jgi:hypothetical protein
MKVWHVFLPWVTIVALLIWVIAHFIWKYW